MTDFRMSMPALDVVFSSLSGAPTGLHEIDRPLFAATQVMAHPGTYPSVTVPVFGGQLPDVLPDTDGLWEFLAEPAEFFGLPMPARTIFAQAIAGFVDQLDRRLVAMTVTIVEDDGAAHVVVTGAAVQRAHTEAVRVEVCDAESPLARSNDPRWLRMAARTTSKAEGDRIRRWLTARGYVDAVSDGPRLGVPFLGALVFERDSDVCGVDNDEPTSILLQLLACGAIASVRRVPACPVDAERAWWISPGYECHPVAAIGAHEYATDAAGPSFARVP